MFEGKPPIPAQADADNAPADGQGEALRAVSWSELVAKLTAARDFRAILSSDDGELPASFDANSARRLAATHEDCGKEGHGAVNLPDSVNLKGDEGKSSAQDELHRPDTRGNT